MPECRAPTLFFFFLFFFFFAEALPPGSSASNAAIAASAAAESVAKVARETQAGSCIQRLRVQRLCVQRLCVQRLRVQRSLLVYFTHVFRSTSAHAQPRQIRVRVFGLVVFSIRQTS